MENPPKKYFRLSPGNEVRLRYSYLIKCDEVIKDEEGKIVDVKISYTKNYIQQMLGYAENYSFLPNEN